MIKPYCDRDNIVIYHGDTREVLEGLESNSVDMVMTSPPYWGLRDYGTAPLIWDNKDGCEHEFGEDFTKKLRCSVGISATVTSNVKECQPKEINNGTFCTKCNAWKGSLGLEPTYQLYIKHLIQIFDEGRRVLKDAGSCWVNIGDSYLGSGQGGGDTGFSKERHKKELLHYKTDSIKRPSQNYQSQAKSLAGIPERFVIAMQDSGWIRRNTIIWHKPSCMPSSADDRFTVDFEYLYFFTKKSDYYFEQQLEAYTTPLDRWGGDSKKITDNLKENSPYTPAHRERDMRPNPNGRNKRGVWSINPQPYSGAHYAVYPEKLCETPIKAGCPEGGVVADIFMGSGTTLRKARELGRKGIGIELNEADCERAIKRIELNQKLLFRQ